MLAGEAVVAIWNGIAPEGQAEFYAWHLHEHMPERVGIPGFRRGRRYSAADAATHPAYFTLYEADTMQVLQGGDYLNRLNAPTAWTKSATAHFRDTSRALARVLETTGPGAGGALLTIRFDADPAAAAALCDRVRHAAASPRVTGAHLCAGDATASRADTAETKGRADIQAPPAWFALIEATDAEALAGLLPDAALTEAGAYPTPQRGLYRLEYTRLKTAFA
ncbi:MAG TPA: hypothetical protein VMU82_07835 [Acetobacteraceae bacterium]|nr:hypothetical protein [Acetobacteraceae bacterium]